LTGRLSAEHLAELNSSRISQEFIDSRGYRTVGPDWRETLKEHGCPAWAMRDDSAFPALVLPMYRPRSGEFIGFQFKPAVPQPRPGTDKTVKYVSPRGMGNRLDVHPMVRDRVNDPAATLWITEGIKKADALSTRGAVAVTLTGVWNWRNQQGALGDWEDVPLKDRRVIVCFDADAVDNPQVRSAMMRLVGWLRSRGADAAYLVVPAQINGTAVKGVDDYLAAGGTAESLTAHVTQAAPQAPSSRDAAFSDAFLTDTVCEETLQGRYLFAQGLGWMRYDGSRWRDAAESAVVEEIRQWVKGHWEAVVEEYKHDQSRDVKARMDGWKQLLTNARIKALASLARGPLLTHADQFDAHPDLLNCPNGVVDLRTGELLEPDAAYLMTKMAGVPYDPTATHPDFVQALAALPPEVQGWYQVRVGQAATGHMASDDLMVVQKGGGKNGKSTLAGVITRALGTYHVLVSDRVLLGNHDQHPTELMDLKGARYALMEETPEARQLNVQQLKKVVGTPQITARRIRQDPVTFDASHSLFVNTNFAPAVVETDYGTWRRLAMVRFPYTYRAAQEDVRGPMDRLGDARLRERLLEQETGAQAALAWMVAGAAYWYEHGFPALPELVVKDTEEWRREGDLIMAFADDRLTFGPEHHARLEDLFQAFGQWLAAKGHKPWTQKTFQSRFSSHDYITDRHAEYGVRRVDGLTKRAWWGVQLVPQNTDMMLPGRV